jgi:hypothetical protein
MEIAVFSDCHWNGPTPVDIEPEFGENIFYIGDNHELKNIPFDKVPKYSKQYLDFLAKCKSSNTAILNGNHEVSIGYNNIDLEVLLPENKSIAMVHFHRESWPIAKVVKWHDMTPGKSKMNIFKIKIKNIIKNKLGSSNLKNKHKDICLKIAKKYNVKNVVFGHTHPKKLIVEMHNEITMVNVPRGKSTLLYKDTEQKIVRL